MASRKVSLRIPLSGLEVYLVDGSRGVSWNPVPSRLFGDEEGKYTLNVQGEEGAEFKCFVWVKVGQDANEIRRTLEKSGFKITGEGDVFQNRIRLWFLVPNLEDTGNGVWSNNVWGDEAEVLYPKHEVSDVRGTKPPTDPPPPKEIE